jgi:predicted metalloprotease with PDZ domain
MATLKLGDRPTSALLLFALAAAACGRASDHTAGGRSASAGVAKGPGAAGASGPILLTIDAREAPKRIIHAHLSIPAKPGPLSLHYPKWIPGTHSPSNAIANLVGLQFSLNHGLWNNMPWQRDPLDLYHFTIDVPEKGARALDVDLDYVAPPKSLLNSPVLAGEARGEGPFEGGQSTPNLLDLGLGSVVLYPDGNPDDLLVSLRVRLPAGWNWASTLTPLHRDGDEIEFAPVSLETLIDSPIVAGAHLKSIPLTPGEPRVTLDLVADTEEALAASPKTVSAYKKLVAEAEALFGAHHYRDYHFLVSLSDDIVAGGLGHHESSDDRLPERAFIDEEAGRAWTGLLAHEYVHSWNGKYRRPAGLQAADFQAPLDSSLLWVYEGLTEYLGNVVLASRSGLRSDEDTRETLAAMAGSAAVATGRIWRPLADTAVAAQALYEPPPGWGGWRRGAEVNGEGALIWLEVDTVIRDQTGGKRSIDDFCRLFLGSKSGPPEVRPYDFDALLAALGEIAPYDWKTFFETRVQAFTMRAPFGGFEAAGWRLNRTEAPNTALKAWDAAAREDSAWFTLGMTVKDDGTISDVAKAMPAATAGLYPGARLVSIAGRKYQPGVLAAAIAAAKSPRGSPPKPIELLVEDGHSVRAFPVVYSGGLFYPHLIRDPNKPDLLSEILKARAP